MRVGYDRLDLMDQEPSIASDAAGAPPGSAAPLWLHGMLGIEAGIRGGLFLCLLYLANALWNARPWWTHFNLLGATFSGDRAFRSGPGWDTVSGLALALALGGVVGGLFGLAVRRMSGRAVLLMAGLVTAAVCHAVSMWWIWPNVNVWVPDRLPASTAAVGQVLLGLSLGRIARPERAAQVVAMKEVAPSDEPPAEAEGERAAEDPPVPLE